MRRAEIQHDQTLDTLGLKLDQSIKQFEDLDVSLSNHNGFERGGSRGDGGAGGNIAVQIGEKLEELDRKRRRAQDANFLIQCWLEVSETGELTSLQDIQRQGGAENKVRCAIIAHQLMRIGQRLDVATWGQTNGKTRGVTNGVTGVARSNHNTREAWSERRKASDEMVSAFSSTISSRCWMDCWKTRWMNLIRTVS